jgi:putative ABC transport system substrate-binding protein
VEGGGKEAMKKKITGLTLCVLLFALCFPADAQQAKKIPRIGFVTSFGAPSEGNINSFRQGLRDLGYSEGKSILIDYRQPEGNVGVVSDVVVERVQLKVDVLVTTDPTAIRAAKQATKTIPIVMLTNQDPVATGLVESLAHPGGNVTGITRLARELSGKRLELLKEIAPRISRVGVLWVQPTALGQGPVFESYEAAAHALNVKLQSLQVSRPNPDIDGAFQNAIQGRASALIMVTHAVLTPHTKKIADLAIKNHLPLMSETSSTVTAGSLASYASNDVENYRRAAVYVDKILKGAKPADLPVEQPTKFEFVINLKTAKQIGLTMPPNILARADRIIR